ncbi:MAG: DUF423 domain-containing protein [Bacteroidetes bacterium]|nr:DUF423 domain-containing protein [Bacteroidota bacterium]
MKNAALQTFRLTGILGALTVAMGALGAHQFKKMVGEEAISVYETGIYYQFFHVLALAFLGLAQQQFPAVRALNTVKWLWLTGIICFSGSIYLLALRSLIPFSVSWAGPITPLGGVCFIAGWIALAYALKK